VAIFEPLGMADTGFYRDAADADRYASVYSLTEAGLTKVPEEPVEIDDGGEFIRRATHVGPNTYFSGGAGLTSTIAYLREISAGAPEWRTARRYQSFGASYGAVDGARSPGRAWCAGFRAEFWPGVLYCRRSRCDG